ncbi:hypothetical protein [Enorma massiliensis]|uniref:hypothetical protein n=1 Tax=Enorma massiliensis TaxID=1472761 RepID=UPI0034A0E804
MNIKLYELREDEKPALAEVMARLGAGAASSEIEVDAVAHELTLESAGDLRGYDAVVISGRSAMTADLLDRLAELGVKYLATRTVGVDHIDVAHAHELGLRVCNTGYPP